MYRAVSQALFVHDRRHGLLSRPTSNRNITVPDHMDLRQKVADEIRENRNYYDKDSPNFASELAKDSRILLSSYSHYLQETPKDGTYSDINHIYALSSVIKRPIHCFFPSTNPKNNPFQRVVIGRGVKDVKERDWKKIQIMWTASVLPSPFKIQNLIIDHFVPLIMKYDLPDVLRPTLRGIFNIFIFVFGI